ncbi:MAG: hypothetical protein AAF637_03105 [Pseudomonadota bacterium]
MSGYDNFDSMRRDFDRGFDTNVVKENQQDYDNEGDPKTKGKHHGGGGPAAPNTMGNQSMQVMFLICMEAAYNSNSVDMMNKANGMEASKAQAQNISNATNAVTSAELNAENGGNNSITIKTTNGAPYACGNVAYIPESDIKLLQSFGLDVKSGEKINIQAVSALTSAMNNQEQSLSSNNEYTLLQVQLDSQNVSQDSSEATSGEKTIGDALGSVARNL